MEKNFRSVEGSGLKFFQNDLKPIAVCKKTW